MAHGLAGCGLRALWARPAGSLGVSHRLRSCTWDLSSPTWDWIQVPFIAEQILNHGTTREAPFPLSHDVHCHPTGQHAHRDAALVVMGCGQCTQMPSDPLCASFPSPGCCSLYPLGRLLSDGRKMDALEGSSPLVMTG